MIFLTETPIEGGTFLVTVSFYDEKGNAVTPQSLKWTLSDMEGRVVNNRSEEEISDLSSTVDIFLTGDDLAVFEDDNTRRILTVWGTYNSSHGNNLPLREQFIFEIEKLIAVNL